MSYTPTEWKTGDVITAENLNNMESGILNANQNVYIATLSYDGSNYSCDKTPEQIKSAADGGAVVFLKYGDQYNTVYFPIFSTAVEDDNTFIVFRNLTISNAFQDSFMLVDTFVNIVANRINYTQNRYNVSVTKQ